MELFPNAILYGPFWNEPVRVLTVQPLSEGRVRIETVGLDTRRYAAQNSEYVRSSMKQDERGRWY